MGYERYYCSVTGVLLLPETPCQIAGFFVTMGLIRPPRQHPGSQQSIPVAAMPSGFLKAPSAEGRLMGFQIRTRKSRAVQAVR